MIRVGEKLLQRYGARLPMMAGPVLTAIAIALISCTFLEKALYIGVVFASNVLFGLGWAATPRRRRIPRWPMPRRTKSASPRGSIRWAARWAGR